jgi:hypothetical protein
MRSLAFVLLVCGGTAWADTVGPADFAWRFPVEGPVRSGAVYRIEIPAEVYGRAEAFPADLRFFDDEGRAWPFFLEPDRPEERVHTVAATRLNDAWVDAPEPYHRVDLAVPHASGVARARHNRVEVDTSGTDFLRKIEAYGSDDQQTWALLGRGFIMEMMRPRLFRERVLAYPESDYPFIQVRVYPNTRNALEEFAVGSVELQRRETEQVAVRSLGYRMLETPAEELRAGRQSVVLDLGYDGVPFTRVRVQGRGDYVRRVEVWTRDDAAAEWRFAGAGDVHRIGASVKDEVAASARARFIRIDLHHDDDPPLEIESVAVEASRPYLVVEAVSDESVALYTGSAWVEPARFDAARRLGAQGAGWLAAVLGPGEENAGHRPAGWGRWGGTVAALAVGVASLAVLWVIVRMVRRTVAEPPEAGG